MSLSIVHILVNILGSTPFQHQVLYTQQITHVHNVIQA